MRTKEVLFILEEHSSLGYELREELIKRVKAYDHYKEIMNTLKALELVLKIWE